MLIYFDTFFLLVAMRLCGHVDDAFVNVHACLCVLVSVCGLVCGLANVWVC